MNVVTYYVSDLTFIFWVQFHILYVSYKECVPAVLLEVLSSYNKFSESESESLSCGTGGIRTGRTIGTVSVYQVTC